MDIRSDRSIFPLLFPSLIGLAFLLFVPIICMLQIEARHHLIDTEIDPVEHHARSAIELGYKMHSDVLYYLYTLSPDYSDRYYRDRKLWEKMLSTSPGVTSIDPRLVPPWHDGLTSIGDWMRHDAEPSIKSGAQDEAVEAISRFGHGIEALDTASNLAATRALAERAVLRQIWQTALAAETGGGFVGVLLALFAWRNASALRVALDAASDGSDRLALAVKETNHRVKNNLQTIGALIDMSRQEHGETIPRHVLDEVYQQVRTVAAVHDFLSHEHFEDRVNTEPLLHRLAKLASDATTIRTSVHAITAVLPVKEATSVALITNELVLNAVKHGATSAVIDFCHDVETYILRVTDDGPGLPPDFSVPAYANIGLNLVETLAKHDLNGSARWSNCPGGGGVCAEIVFPVPK